MSELKATTVYDAYWKANSVGEGTGILVYLKSEADKVIAEKDNVITYARALVREDIKIIFHQKYKRCLAMAKYCDASMAYFGEFHDSASEQIVAHYYKWRGRWYELAEKFKEVEK